MYVLKDTGLLTGYGAATVFSAGVSFWARYGRTLYNASGSGLAYDSVFANGTARPKITLRTTGQSRIWNSQINWALGFFGPSFNATPDPYLTAWNAPFNVTIIPEGGTENNTLASYDSCFNDNLAANGYNAAQYQDRYKKIYLRSAVYRLQKFAPAGFSFDYKDLYAMQTTCAYEYAFIGASAYCDIFTDEEWAGFENIQDMKCESPRDQRGSGAERSPGNLVYFLYSFGNPTGRAQGIGYVQELLARIKHEYITFSNSSINATLDQNADNFPVNQQIYADFSHDDIIISALTALSIDYFKDPPTLTKFPPSANNHFTLSHLVPFGANLITEIIGCGSASPEPVEQRRIFYTPSQYGYDAANARYKFIRMRLNNAVLPLSTIRGGKCGDLTSGRLDGLCELPKFLESQQDSYSLSNYDYACFGNYTLPNATEAIDYDGAIFQGKDYAQREARCGVASSQLNA